MKLSWRNLKVQIGLRKALMSNSESQIPHEVKPYKESEVTWESVEHHHFAVAVCRHFDFTSEYTVGEIERFSKMLHSELKRRYGERRALEALSGLGVWKIYYEKQKEDVFTPEKAAIWDSIRVRRWSGDPRLYASLEEQSLEEEAYIYYIENCLNIDIGTLESRSHCEGLDIT
jgi:hypothetical protein